jgi:hypothetical protein
LLDWEGERLIRQREADWDAAQERDKVEKDREEEAEKAALLAKYEATFNRSHLVGYFILIYIGGKERKGIVMEKFSYYSYTVLLLDGNLEKVDSRFFKVIQQTDIEQQTFRNLGYTGPFSNHGHVS